MRFKKILFFLISITIPFLLISCGDNSTGPEPEEPTDTTGVVEVTVSTSGSSSDEDGYTVTIGDEAKDTDPNDTVTFGDLEEGSYSIEMSGLGAGCIIDGENPVTVNVSAGETTETEFDVICDEWELEGTILFAQRVDGISQIFKMNADGSDVQQITDTGIEDTYPEISPDGQRIVFVRRDMESGSLDNEIWVMDIDGSNQERLTDNPVSDIRPAWSPDGTQIVFESAFEGSISIFVVDADGGTPQAITDDEGNDHSATWSEDHGIAFVSDRQGDDSADIYVVQPDGTGLDILIDAADDNGINLFEPAWSPDGTRIAYQGFSSLGAAHVFVANADGSSADYITSSELSARQPSWSPDGENIAFTNIAGGNSPHAIWAARADGSQVLKLMDDEADESSFPSWGVTAE